MQALWLGTWARFLLGSRLAPFVPTPRHVARCMLDLARVGPADTVYDLGCGDGRLLILGRRPLPPDPSLYPKPDKGMNPTHLDPIP